MNLSLAHLVSYLGRNVIAPNPGARAMAMNRIQFQAGVSMPEFFERYGSEEQCAAELTAQRWPDGFRCPRCAAAAHYVVGHGA